MIENICNKLTLKIRKEMPEVDDERAEVINYGLQLVIGEVPKTFILLIIAYLCGVLKLSIIWRSCISTATTINNCLTCNYAI